MKREPRGSHQGLGQRSLHPASFPLPGSSGSCSRGRGAQLLRLEVSLSAPRSVESAVDVVDLAEKHSED